MRDIYGESLEGIQKAEDAKALAHLRGSVMPDSRDLLYDDPMVADMVVSMARLGLVASLNDDTWRLTSVEIVRGVDVDVPIPIVPVVEMLTADVWEMTWEAAKSVAPMVYDHFVSRCAGFEAHAFHTRGYLDWVTPCNSAHVAEDIHVKVMEILLEAQGWLFYRLPVTGYRRVRSPAWLYPPSEVSDGVVREFVRERMNQKAIEVSRG